MVVALAVSAHASAVWVLRGARLMGVVAPDGRAAHQQRVLLGVASRMLPWGADICPGRWHVVRQSTWCTHNLKFVIVLFVQDVHLPPQAFLRVRRSRSFRHALVRLGHGTVQPRKYLKVHLTVAAHLSIKPPHRPSAHRSSLVNV